MSLETSLSKYGTHRFSLQPNSDNEMVSKCINCKLAKAYLQLFDKTECKTT